MWGRFGHYGDLVSNTVTMLSDVTLFSQASRADLEDLASSAYTKRLSRGQVLFSAGEPSEHLYVVVTGRVKVLVSSERGDSLVLAMVGAGEALGELSVLDGHPRSAGAEALDDVELLCVPAAALRRLLERSPAVCLAVAEELAARLRVLTGSAADLVFLDLPRRLAKLLVSRDDLVDLPQAEVAAQLGVTRPSLNRSLSSFQRRGWVEVSRGRVEVLDREALLRFAES